MQFSANWHSANWVQSLTTTGLPATAASSRGTDASSAMGCAAVPPAPFPQGWQWDATSARGVLLSHAQAGTITLPQMQRQVDQCQQVQSGPEGGAEDLRDGS